MCEEEKNQIEEWITSEWVNLTKEKLGFE